MTNPIEYLQSKGLRITSDPSTYRDFYPDGPLSDWGYRNYWEWHNGKKIYHDDYCDGWHLAYDLSDKEGADLPAVVSGKIVEGTSSNGNFGGTVVLADHAGDYQYIYGHCKNLTVKVGDTVEQGDKLAEQSSTNYYDNPMSSHLHFQVQPQETLDEKAFVCSGINPLSIDVNEYKTNNKRKKDDIVANYKVVNMWVPSSKFRIKAPYSMNPTTITIHNTANTASARNEVAYMRRNNNMTSYHAAVDDKEVVQAIPFNRNAWAAGDGASGQGNRRSIHVEIAYSMDNGYSGAYSARHRKAEENAALYVAYILDQYGWGTDRIRQHYAWTRKDCPHKMRAHNGWNKFVKRVQEHLDAIQGKASKTAPAAPSKKETPKASGTTYTVRSGDTLWGISKASGVSVANLKSFNCLKSNTIIVGQKLNLNKTSSDGKYPKATMGEFRTNKYGIQWAPATGVWINGGQPIEKRKGTPSRKAKSTGMMKPGQRLDYREIARNDGHIWLLDLKSDQWVPVKTWNAKSGKVGSDWGSWK